MALATQRAELEAEAKHARVAAVREAEEKAAASRRAAFEANDEAVAKAEERAAQHKARLDGVVAQLDSEKEECQRVKAAATEAAAVAAAEKALVVRRAEAAEQATKAQEAAAAQLRAEVDALQSARRHRGGAHGATRRRQQGD